MLYGSLGKKPEHRHLFSGERMVDDMKSMFFSNIQVAFSLQEVNTKSQDKLTEQRQVC